MASKLLDQEWLRNKLTEAYPQEDLYHTLLRDGEYRALQKILKARNHDDKEEIKRLEEQQKKLKKADHSLTMRYAHCAKVDRFLADLAQFKDNQQP